MVENEPANMQVGTFCPNCSANLKGSEEIVCWNCSAEFGPGSTWKPTARPLGEFREIVRTKPVTLEAENAEPPMSTAETIIRLIVAGPLFLLGGGLLILALSQLGPFAGIPGLLCIAAAVGVMGSRSASASIAAFAFAGVLVLLLFGGLQMLGAAIFSR